MDNPTETLFAGPGRLPALCREFDWSGTPLGPVDSWPGTLRVAVQMVLASGIPQIILWGRELIQIYNDPYAELIQAKHPAALGHGNLEIWPEVAHINAPIFDRVFEGETVTRKDALYPLERSGEIEDVYLTISYSPIRDPEGAVGGVLATMIETTADVTLRAMQAEREQLHRELDAQRQRLSTAFQQAPAFIAMLRGPDHTFEMANPAYRQLVGNRPVVGRTVAEALPEVVGQGFIPILDDAYASGEAFVGREMIVELDTDHGTEERVLNFVYQPLRDAAGEVEGILVHGVDVTDTVEARREAEEANRAKTEFLASMSHELRTPLNAIAGYADLLDAEVHGPISDEQRQALSRIQVSQRILLQLINDVLNFAKIGTGQLEVRSERVGIGGLVADLQSVVQGLADKSEVELDLVPCPDSLAVFADPDRVQQILLNLLGNAIKFTPAGGEVTLTCESAGESVYMHVRDTGPGIADRNQARIFDPFVQIGESGDVPATGMGLGLAISRDLARSMDGDLTVESHPGEGSRFTLRLPRAS